MKYLEKSYCAISRQKWRQILGVSHWHYLRKEIFRIILLIKIHLRYIIYIHYIYMYLYLQLYTQDTSCWLRCLIKSLIISKVFYIFYILYIALQYSINSQNQKVTQLSSTTIWCSEIWKSQLVINIDLLFLHRLSIISLIY